MPFVSFQGAEESEWTHQLHEPIAYALPTECGLIPDEGPHSNHADSVVDLRCCCLDRLSRAVQFSRCYQQSAALSNPVMSKTARVSMAGEAIDMGEKVAQQHPVAEERQRRPIERIYVEDFFEVPLDLVKIVEKEAVGLRGFGPVGWWPRVEVAMG